MGKASLVVAFRGELVLAVCNPDTRALSLPGGHIEPGETPEQAARWELFEETGLTAGILVPLRMVRTTDTPCHVFWAPRVSGALKASPEGYPLWVMPSELLERPRGPGFAQGALLALSAAWQARGRQEGRQHAPAAE